MVMEPDNSLAPGKRGYGSGGNHGRVRNAEGASPRFRGGRISDQGATAFGAAVVRTCIYADNGNLWGRNGPGGTLNRVSHVARSKQTLISGMRHRNALLTYRRIERQTGQIPTAELSSRGEIWNTWR